MKKILFAGNSLSQISGLAYVSASLMTLFKKALADTEIAYATLQGSDSTGNGLIAQGKEFAETFKDIPLYNVQLSNKDRAMLFDPVVASFQPDLILSVHDPWILEQIAYSVYRDSYCWVAYQPIEAPEYPPQVMVPSPLLPYPRKSIKAILARADLIIPYTPMGQDALLRMGLTTGRPVLNGVDFSQRCIESVAKAEIFGDLVPENGFVFMTMGENSERKRLDRVLQAFSVFLSRAKNPSRFKLDIHSDLDSIQSTTGADIRSMISEMGLEQSVLFPENPCVSKSALYRLYKACDCYIGLPSAEGFGYGFAEAMMHGLPLVYINYGGHLSYCMPAGIPVDVQTTIPCQRSTIPWALADIESAARAMERIATDRKLRRDLSRKGEKIAARALDWNVVFPDLFNQVADAYELSRQTGLPREIMLRRIV